VSAVRVAVIGAGYFSRFHIDAWSRLDGAELVAIVDTDIAKAEAAVNGCATFTDVEAMLDAVSPDLVDIVTPPATHRALVEAVAARNLPMICQKPLAPTLAEAEEIARLADAAGVTLLVHENFRWQPWYRESKRLLDAGALGAVTNAWFRLRPGDGQGPNAYLDRQPYFQDMPRFLVHETAIHLIDTFRFLFGEATWVQAHLRRLNPAIAGEDAGLIVFGFDDVTAVFDGNRLLDHPAEDRRLTMGELLIEGTEASLRLDGNGRLTVRRFGERLERPHWYAWENIGFGGDCVFALQAHALAVLDGAAPENTAKAYLRNLEIEDAVYRSAADGVRVALP